MTKALLALMQGLGYLGALLALYTALALGGMLIGSLILPK